MHVLSFTILVTSIAVPSLAQTECQYYFNINSNSSFENCIQCSDVSVRCYNCKTFMDALNKAEAIINPGSLTCVYLLTYELSSGEHNLTNQVLKFRHTNEFEVSIMGDNSHVLCSGAGTGLDFESVNEIYIQNVTFLGCSSLYPSTTKRENENDVHDIYAALYFTDCVTVHLNSVTVNTSFGVTAVVMYNPTNADISDSNFISTTLPGNDSNLNLSYAGGGFVLELNCINSQTVSCQQSFYTFAGCSFQNNHAHFIPDVLYDGILPNGASSKGGGLSIIVKGNTIQKVFRITGCRFENNSASHGGGLFVSFQDQTGGNNISIQNSSFEGNVCPLTDRKRSTGGGIHVENLVSIDYNQQSNYISQWSNNSIENNTAYSGGGVFLTSNNYRFLSRCNNNNGHILYTKFTSNTAIFGSAIHIHRLQTAIRQNYSSELIISNCMFDDNRISYPSSVNSIETGMGSVYSYQNDITFEDSVVFSRNKGSALAMISAIADFSGCRANFTNNSGTRGGAVALLGTSYIFINNGTTMSFNSNNATYKGGAVYNQYLEQASAMQYANCFIRHTDPHRDPNSWGAKFIFNRNLVLDTNRHNAIHSTSILPCGTDENSVQPFCWKGWIYDDIDYSPGMCNEIGKYIISTDANEQSFPIDFSVKAFPGWSFELPLVLKDDLNQSITDNVEAYVTKDSDRRLISVSTKDNVTLKGSSNGQNLKYYFQSMGDRSIQVGLDVNLQNCPPGFINENNSTCTCARSEESEFGNSVVCLYDLKPVAAVTMNNNWIGHVDNSSEYFMSYCPTNFCSLRSSKLLILPNNSNDLNSKICGKDRTGVLCGECAHGTCLAVNTWNHACIADKKHTSVGYSILKYITMVYISFAIVLVTIALFYIKLTSGSLNGFVLFAQLITTTFDLTLYDAIHLGSSSKHLPKIYRFIYGIFSSNFLEKIFGNFCFSTNFNTLSVLALHYLLFILPTGAVIVIIVCVKFSKQFIRKEDSQNAEKSKLRIKVESYCYGLTKPPCELFILLFSTICLLSFTKLSNSSSQILSVTRLMSIDGKRTNYERAFFAGQLPSDHSEYRYYKAIAIFFEIFLILFTLLLLDYPLRITEFFIKKVKILSSFYPMNSIHAFVDIFQNCFRTPFKGFAGVYFIFRFAVSIVYVTSYLPMTKYLVQELLCIVMILLLVISKPYKQTSCNYTDIFIFANLAAINALNFFQLDYFQFTRKMKASNTVFTVQFTLAIIPALCLLACLLFRFTRGHHIGIKNRVHRISIRLINDRKMPLQTEAGFFPPVDDQSSISESETASVNSRQERFKNRKSRETRSRARGSVDEDTPCNVDIPVTVVGVCDKENDMGEAATYQTSISEGYYLRTEWNSGQGLYGSNTKLQRKS